MTLQEFGQKIKSEYPQYNDVPDIDLAQKMLSKYPQYKDLVDISNVSISVNEDIISSEKFKSFFPSEEGESALGASLKVLGNIPSSAYQFAKGIIKAPVEAVKIAQKIGEEAGAGSVEMGTGKLIKESVKELPSSIYQVLVPEFFKNLFKGDLEEAKRTIVNDPVGQLAPVILSMKWIADSAGKSVQFNKVMKNISKPIIAPTQFLGKKVISGIGNVASQGLGVTTGVGKMPIQEAYSAGKQGIKGTQFSESMRGKIEANGVVDTAFSALDKIKETRKNQYLSDLKNLPTDKKINIIPIKKELTNQLKNYRVETTKNGELDFSKSPLRNKTEAVNDITTIYEDIRGWKDNSPLGIDALKRGIDMLYSPTGSARGFVETMKKSVKDTLIKEVPEYEKLTSNYAKTSNLINELKSGLSLGGRAGIDTILRKIISTVREDNNFRYQLITELERMGKQELTQQAAGTMLNQLTARGLVGRGTEIGAVTAVIGGLFSPKILFGLLATSPRLVGEFVNALGFTSEKTKAFLNIINNLQGNRTLPPFYPKLENEE